MVFLFVLLILALIVLGLGGAILAAKISVNGLAEWPPTPPEEPAEVEPKTRTRLFRLD